MAVGMSRAMVTNIRNTSAIDIPGVSRIGRGRISKAKWLTSKPSSNQKLSFRVAAIVKDTAIPCYRISFLRLVAGKIGRKLFCNIPGFCSEASGL